jgi:iron complex outermembrane receptor protein
MNTRKNTAVPFALSALVCTLSNTSVNAQTTDAQTANATELERVEVVGRRQGGGYEAADVSGTKSDLPLRELPQSVRVISRQAIDDLGAIRLDDVLDYVGGISRQNNFGGLWDNIAIRGLPGNENTGMAMLRNGFAANRGFNAPRDLADVERVEFLKGPAAALYGASEPGGTVNLVTKKPLWRAGMSAELYAGNYDSYRAAIDTTAPLSASFAYRVNAAIEDRGSFRDFVKTERAVFAPAFTWKIGANTTLDYNGQWLRHRTPLDRGVQAIGGVLGTVARSQFPGEPNDGDVTVENTSHQFVFEHEFNSDWRARAALGAREGTLYGFSTEPSSIRSDNRTLWRQRRERDYKSDDLSVQGELLGRIKTGAISHDVLLGVETYRFNLDQLMRRINPTAAAPYAIDLLTPVYGQARPTPLPNTDTREAQRGVAFTVQDAISFSSHWRAVAGVRVDRVRQSLDNRRTGARTEQNPTETLPRLGVSYLPNAQWTFYANAGKSFRANAGSNAAGRAFEPESGTAYEVGAKWESLDKRLGATVALFDITKRNVLTPDPANAGFSVTAGRVSSTGMEFDLAGQLTKHWRVTGSLSYADVDAGGGARLLNVPKINGSVLAVYESTFAGGSRYGIGGGVTHMGRRLGETGTSFDLPAYTTAKLVAYWSATPTLRVSLDVDNVFDRTYYTSSFSRVWVTPGTPRNVILGVQAKF